ncbi:unnamed protein product [Sordaria macrospora k-hell]|uniref:WGS project CABT00000000 data, contig 2.52 n=1 Tax=Sordaria macrospora (strain ATCC MYA-333 / DSM 997 / K(L3346) / K-hell) TaxID=771870 RepID=F7W9G4_SORMK|nr:uncharacterized protein SMAC_08076 [Sordaria macrospora k-hell]CCC13955.1 unnamed protein product [Sordaria macrospora k-hell]
MITISPNKRRILGSLNPNLNASAPCPEPGSKSEFEGGQLEQELELQVNESSLLPSAGSCEKDRGEQNQEPARKRVCLERDHRGPQHQHQHQQHQQIEAGYIGHRNSRNQSSSASPTEREFTVLFNSKSTTNNCYQPFIQPAWQSKEHKEQQPFPPAPMATNQIAYPAGLVGGGGVGGTFNSNHNHKQQPKRTKANQNPRLRLPNQAARQKAEILRLRLSLAAYKIQTGQTDVPLEQLEVVRSSLPWFQSQRPAGGGGGSDGTMNHLNGYHDFTDYSASWSFISNSSTNSNNSSQGQGQGYVQRVNHLRHAAGAAIEAVQAKQERRTAWGREREREQYREWYEQFRHHHHHHQTSAWEDVAAEQGHEEFSKDQRRRRQHRTVRSESGRKPLPDPGTRDSWDGSASTGTAAAVTTGAMTTTAAATTSPHFSRVDLAERALQAHQRLHSRAVTEEVLMEHEHEHDEIDEEDSLQVAHQQQQHQQQRHQQYLTTNHAHNGWVVVPPTTENIQEVPDDIGEAEGRRELDLDDNDEEEELISHRVVGSGSGYSTEPEPQPELPSLPSYEVDVGLQDQAGSGGEEEEEGGRRGRGRKNMEMETRQLVGC